MSDERKCSICGADESEAKLIKYYHKGKEEFSCTKCLPMLIHG